MAQAYTPGLQVAPRVTLTRDRVLPLPGVVLVKPGDVVDAERIVARAELPGDVMTVNVANLLGATPEELPGYMLKHEGDAVAQDEPLAETRPWLAFMKSVVRAPCAGVLESVSKITGQALIRGPAKPIELAAHISGVVDEALGDVGVRVRCEATFIQGILGVGREVGGPLMIAGEPGRALTADMLRPEHAGAVVVCGGRVTREALTGAASLGLRGLIAAGIHAGDLTAWMGYELGVAITGDEALPLSLVLTEGFGDIAMAGRTHAMLNSRQGAWCSLSARTQIRAGVIRPEIIIPWGQDAPTDAATGDARQTGLEPGTTVRLIRDPYFGMLGKVVALPSQPCRIATQALVRVVEVRLDDGQTLTVPRANVELLE